MTLEERDILISKFMEGSLSEDERTTLQAVFATSPELEREVEQMAALDRRMLPVLISSVAIPQASFLDSVEARVISNMNAQSTNSRQHQSNHQRTSSSASHITDQTAQTLSEEFLTHSEAAPSAGFSSTIAHGFASLGSHWVITGLIVAGVSVAAYMLALKPANTPDVPKTVVVQTDHAQTNDQLTLPKSGETKTVLPPAIQNNSDRTVPSVSNPSDDNLSAILRNSSGMDSDLAVIRTLKTQLEQMQKSSDLIGSAMLAKRIGALYRQLGDPKAGDAYLEQALTSVRNLGMKELEADILGELGLVQLQNGNRKEAKQLIEQCIALLKLTNSSDLPRWEQELKKVEATSKKNPN